VRAGHADVIANAYANAAAQLQALKPPERARGAQAALTAGLARARNGYVALSAALRSADRKGYLAAAKSIASGEQAANDAMRSLAPLGYRIH
jgi:hypothetical protein